MIPAEARTEGRPAGAPPEPACCVKGCRADALYTPVLHVALENEQRVSHVPLPMRLCLAHRGGFPSSFLTAERRAAMELTLRSRGRAAPDWARTTVEFVGR